jgi:MFS family permease
LEGAVVSVISVASAHPVARKMVAPCNMFVMSATRCRLVTRPFVAVTVATGAFFVYVGMLVPLLPAFIEDELGAGELGVGLSISAFALAAILVRPLIARLIETHGRRVVMVGGSLLAGVAGLLCATVDSLLSLLALRAIAGIGEAALFVGAATSIADMAPPDRRAEAASYFSVAVFGGIGIGPVIGEAVLADDRFQLAFVVAAGFTVLAALLSLAVPHRIETAVDDADASAEPRVGLARFFHPAAVGPGLVLASGIAAFSVFSAFLPEHAKSIGLGGSGGLFVVYSIVCLVLRVAGARLPERLGARRSVSIAFVTIAVALAGLAAFPAAWALWSAAAVIGVGMAFMYPSLMALTVNRVDERERPAAISSFTMFFEIGTVAGGIALGTVAELLGKRSAFGAAVVVCAFGLWVLRAHVAPVTERPALAPSPRPVFVPVAGD